MFRYFFVVHAEKGLIGRNNNKVLKLIFAVFTLAMTVASYVDRFKFISTGNQRPEHTKIQMENLQLPDVVD